MTWIPDQALHRLGESAALPDLTGTRYELLQKLGSGGMATVFLVRDRELDREIALKILDLPDEAGQLADRMMREARVIARLEHPGIVPIHDVGLLPDGRVFYTMKYVRGKTLLDLAGDSPLRERLRIFQKVCEAVAFAHARGVIHRDLKPENIMLGEFGEVLVMDWGLARAAARTGGESHQAAGSPPKTGAAEEAAAAAGAGASLTDHGTVLGTPHYMSPEQAAGETGKVDQRSDVYALGCILRFLISGEEKQPPGQDAPRVAAHPAGVPRALRAVCAKASAAEPDHRYPNALELAQDVSRFLDGQPVTAYRENFAEAAWRRISKNSFLVLLILSYLVMRVLLLLFYRR